MIREVKTNAVTHALDRTIHAVSTVDGTSQSRNALSCAVSAQKTSWVKVCIDEVVQSFALISKCPFR
jgi:hypothetical protein